MLVELSIALACLVSTFSVRLAVLCDNEFNESDQLLFQTKFVTNVVSMYSGTVFRRSTATQVPQFLPSPPP